MTEKEISAESVVVGAVLAASKVGSVVMGLVHKGGHDLVVERVTGDCQDVIKASKGGVDTLPGDKQLTMDGYSESIYPEKLVTLLKILLDTMIEDLFKSRTIDPSRFETIQNTVQELGSVPSQEFDWTPAQAAMLKLVLQFPNET